MGDRRAPIGTDVAVTSGGNSPCEQYLAALFSGSPEAYVELRFRTESGMARAFHGVDHLRDVAAAIAYHALHTDVYVGVLPRARQASRRSDLTSTAAVLWVDCDTPESAAALTDFVPVPSLVVASGTAENRHAYWLLTDAVPIGTIEAANRRLAVILGADVNCTDAARVLRPPSRNHKATPPADVDLLCCEPDARYRLHDVVADVHAGVEPVRRRCRVASASDTDPLLSIEPAVYVERLTGTHVPRHGKVRCPFHEDRTPSLHVYSDPARGWHCYGCGRGGSIYDFGARLFGIEPRGRAFVELRRRLTALLDP